MSKISYFSSYSQVVLSIGVVSFLLFSLFVLASPARAGICDDDGSVTVFEVEMDTKASSVFEEEGKEVGDTKEVCTPSSSDGSPPDKYYRIKTEEPIKSDTLKDAGSVTHVETTEDSLPFAADTFTDTPNLKEIRVPAKLNPEGATTSVETNQDEDSSTNKITVSIYSDVGTIVDENGHLKEIDNASCDRDATYACLAEVNEDGSRGKKLKENDLSTEIGGRPSETAKKDGDDGGCALASSGSANFAFPLLLLFIPAFILARRLGK